MNREYIRELDFPTALGANGQQDIINQDRLNYASLMNRVLEFHWLDGAKSLFLIPRTA